MRFYGFIVVIAIGLMGALGATRTDWADNSELSILAGQRQSAWQDEFDRAVPLRDAAVGFWAVLDYRLFKETEPGAVAGKQGWLFTSEEYLAEPGFDDRLTQRLERVAISAARLDRRGIALVIALVPDKARIMSGQLRRPRPDILEPRYDDALASLRSAGLAVVDLRASLGELARHGQAYMHTDTHWTPGGAQVAARALCPAIDKSSPMRQSFQTSAAGQARHDGDLMAFVGSGPFRELIDIPPETVTRYNTMRMDSGLGLLDDAPPAAGILVGTSYSADATWNFSGFIQSECQIDILNFASSALGPFPPMEALIDGEDLDKLAPEVIVWEIPERYLTLLDGP